MSLPSVQNSPSTPPTTSATPPHLLVPTPPDPMTQSTMESMTPSYYDSFMTRVHSVVDFLLYPVRRVWNMIYEFCFEYFFPSEESTVLRERAMNFLLRTIETSNGSLSDIAIQLEMLDSQDQESIRARFFTRMNRLGLTPAQDLSDLSTEAWVNLSLTTPERLVQFTAAIESQIQCLNHPH